MNRIQNVWKIADLIKGKIESCIQKYMNLEQTTTYLHENHQIDHIITRAIWERLQRGNPDFFKEYYKRCEVARQITKFNDLLAQQVYLMDTFREIELSTTTTAPVAQLQKPDDQLNHHYHQDLIHDQWIASNDFAYMENLIYPLMDPSLNASPPQSEPYYTSDFEGLSFEQFARDFNEQQHRLQVKAQREQQQQQHLLMDQQELYYPQDHQFSTFFLPEQPPEYYGLSNNHDFGDGLTNNNGSDRSDI